MKDYLIDLLASFAEALFYALVGIGTMSVFLKIDQTILVEALKLNLGPFLLTIAIISAFFTTLAFIREPRPVKPAKSSEDGQHHYG